MIHTLTSFVFILKKKTVKYKFVIFAFISHLFFFIREEKKSKFLISLDNEIFV